MAPRSCFVALFALLLLDAQGARHQRKGGRAASRSFAGVPVNNYRADVQDWMIIFKPDATDFSLQEICKGRCDLEGHPDEGGTAFVKFHGTESEAEEMIRQNPAMMDFVEPDEPVYLIPELDEPEDDDGDRSRWGTAWNLERVGVSLRPNAGAGVHIYVADTGIHNDHSDFGGRAIAAIDITTGNLKECTSQDCAKDHHGHGTHCAGTAAGKSYGVASEAKVYSIKVLRGDGGGQSSWSAAGVDWIISKGQKPAVISMSLGANGRSWSDKRSIDDATSKGAVVVVAAGNENSDSCNHSPAWVPSAITVGATEQSGDHNKRASYSNFGECNDIFAPGSQIKSASNSGGSTKKTGTSMACPHVAGAAAIVLNANPGLNADGVLAELTRTAKKGIQGLLSGDPDLFLWIGTGTPAPEACRRRRRVICKTESCRRRLACR